MENKPTIAVIGAGLAGLSAAKTLRESELFSRIDIIEASSKIGGRILAMETFPGIFPDCGAEYCHGENSVYAKIVKKHSKMVSDLELNSYIACDGKMEEFEDYLEGEPEVGEALEDLEENFDKLPQTVTLRNHVENLDFDECRQKLIYSILCADTGADEDSITLKALGAQFSNWQGGETDFKLVKNTQFSCLLAEYAEEIKLITFNKPVVSIDYSSSMSSIFFGDNTQSVYNFVIVTVPLSQLKKGAIQFNPPLPTKYQKAINTLEMGRVAKCFLKLKKPLPYVSLFGITLGADIAFFSPVSVGKNIYCCFISGKNIDSFEESYRNNTLKDRIIEELAEDLEDYDFETNVEAVYWMNWDQMPFIEGAYSVPSEDDADKVRDWFSSPIDGKIGFAGEAFSTEWSSTMDGAYLTGINMAERFMKLVA